MALTHFLAIHGGYWPRVGILLHPLDRFFLIAQFKNCHDQGCNPQKKDSPMKKLILPHSIGVLLALLVFVVFPSSSALAAPKCDPVTFSQNSPGVPINVFMASITPTPFIIFYTVNGSDPVHTGSTPGANTFIYTTSIAVGPGQTVYFRALTYKASPYVDSIITDYKVFNPGD
jgi:hypothetical protein